MTLLSRLSSATGLDHAPRTKQSIKNLVYRMGDPFDYGVPLSVGGISVKVPARFARQPWTNYEPPATRRVAEWLKTRPDAATIDIGCSVALYSLLSLSLAPKGEAWAIDSDLVSLQASRWLCRHAGTECLRVIHGYIGDKATIDISADSASAETIAQLSREDIPDEPSRANYICLDTQAANAIPVHRIDRLFAQADRSRPWLMKVDVEGAEMLVLRGAEAFLEKARPQLMVSVHPPALRDYGLSPADIRAWLTARSYEIAVDVEPHEEHWWCTHSA